MRINQLKTATRLSATAMVFCLWAATLQAQGNVPVIPQQNDAQADRVLKKVKLKMNGASDIKAKFKYSLENRATKSKPMSKVGEIKVKKNNKFRINFTDQELICDGKTVWNVMKPEKEVNVSEYDPSESFSFDKIFKVYDDGMRTRFDAKETASVSKVSLFPTKGKTDYFKIELWVDEVQSIPLKMKVWNRNGSTVTYELSEVRVNSNLNDSDFVFQKINYPGLEVIDMR